MISIRPSKWPAQGSKFVADRSGNVAIIFGIAFLPLIASVGAGLDYTRAAAVRTALQTAIDATALMLSREAQSLTTTQVNEKASTYFNALFNQVAASNVIVTTTFAEPVAGNFSLKVVVNATVDTMFARIFGATQVPLTASSEVMWGIKRLEVALALDNTGSMASSNKMASLKTAAHNLLDKLKVAAKKPDDVKVAIVPFDTYVNIGTGYSERPWFDWSQVSKPSWQGCVEDRSQPFDVQDTPPNDVNSSTLFLASECGSLVKMLPLTSDWTTLKAKIDQMQPSGYTNVTIGLVWAWHALTATAPLEDAAVPQPDLDKVIILLTDGDNTRNRWTSSPSSIDSRTSAACANVKAANIKIYTVRVVDGNADLLRGCATNPSMYYDVQNAGQLNGVFSSIAQMLANLRVAK